MALKPTTIRFAEDAYASLQVEADHQGVSLAQYVREAALIRLVVDSHNHREQANAVSMVDMIRTVRELSRDSEGMGRRADDPPTPVPD